MKAIAYQVFDSSPDVSLEDGWQTIAIVRLKPDGSIEFDGPKGLMADDTAEFGINTSIMQSCWNPDLKPLVDKGDGDMGRFVTEAEGELFLETLVEFRSNGYSRFIPWREERGTDKPLTDEEKARALASGLSDSRGKPDTRAPGVVGESADKPATTYGEDAPAEFDDDLPPYESGMTPEQSAELTAIMFEENKDFYADKPGLREQEAASLEKALRFIAEAPGTPAKPAIAYQVADETPGLGGWRTVSEWRINPEGGLDQTGPDGLVHHDFGMDVFGCESVLEIMLKNKCDAQHRWVEVAGEEKPNPNRQPPAK